MATSKSKTTFNSIDLSISEAKLLLNLSEPVLPLSDCSEKPVVRMNANRWFAGSFHPYTCIRNSDEVGPCGNIFVDHALKVTLEPTTTF